MSLVKLLETRRFHDNYFLFTIDFQNLYTNIPVEGAIQCIMKLIEECNNFIPNANFIVEFLKIVLRNRLMNFDREYFQQFFRVIMGKNVAPILTNL